jgi:hypothetical protein
MNEQTQLVGLYFHTFLKDNEIQWQGIVVGNPQPGWYLVQLFEWLNGTDSNIKLVMMEDMLHWQFYADKAGFDLGYEKLK